MIVDADTPVAHQDPLPDAVDAVVIGAGVAGIATAWFLIERGLSVFVCDKGRVAGEQSSRNWGWIRQQGRDPAELPLVIDSIASWEAIAPVLDTDIGFRRCGVLYSARTGDELARHERWLETAQQHQLDTRMLTSAEVDEFVRGRPGQFKGGMLTPSDGRAEPFLAVPALARALRARGGAVREGCAARTIERTAGRVSGVLTEHGVVRTGSVILAGGAWSSLFLGNLDIRLPQLAVRATVARTAPAPDVCAGNAALGEIAIRRRQDEGYTVASSGTNEHFVGADSFRFFFEYLPALRASVRYLRLRFGGDVMARLLPTRRWADDAQSPFERARVLNPPPSQPALRRMRSGLQRRVPALADVAFVEAWAGMIDVTPDVVPVLDAAPDVPGLFVATGLSGHGFGIGLGVGRVMADMVCGRAPVHDLSRFRFSRFFDGSPMVPGPGL